MIKKLSITHFINAAALVMSCSFLYSCENSQKDIDALFKLQVMKDEVRQVESVMSQDGKIKAKLKAPLMYRYMVGTGVVTAFVEFPTKLHVDFFDDSSRLDSWLDCLYAKYYEQYDKVYLRDSVVVITVKGDTLRSPDLWWDQNKGTFYTDKYAQYHAKDQNIAGHEGMTATQDLKTVTFESPTGVVDVTKAGFSQ